MLSNKIESVRVALGDLAGKVDGENWEVISSCRRTLESVQAQISELEKYLVPNSEDAREQGERRWQ